jgi:hypothetical protein
MQNYKNLLMGITSGISLMILKILGTAIISDIQFRIYPEEVTKTGLIIFGTLYDIITVLSLIGIIITTTFSLMLLKIVIKSCLHK